MGLLFENIMAIKFLYLIKSSENVFFCKPTPRLCPHWVREVLDYILGLVIPTPPLCPHWVREVLDYILGSVIPTPSLCQHWVREVLDYILGSVIPKTKNGSNGVLAHLCTKWSHFVRSRSIMRHQQLPC